MSKVDELLVKHGIAYPPCGAHIGEGWLFLVDKLFSDMIAAGWDKDLQQLKEKFGGLRVYIGTWNEPIKQLIRGAYEVAAITCEECGEVGKLRNCGGRMATMCQKHFDEYPNEDEHDEFSLI